MLQMRDFSRAEEIAQVKVQRPHVVILGAGASLASLPNGDKNGKSLPLMKKDLIATFNWDPLLTQAYRRNSQRVTLPPLYFLHGNVTIGYCQTDNNMGVNWNPCSRCDLPFTPTKLFYPISEKDYHLDA